MASGPERGARPGTGGPQGEGAISELGGDGVEVVLGVGGPGEAEAGGPEAGGPEAGGPDQAG